MAGRAGVGQDWDAGVHSAAHTELPPLMLGRAMLGGSSGAFGTLDRNSSSNSRESHEQLEQKLEALDQSMRPQLMEVHLEPVSRTPSHISQSTSSTTPEPNVGSGKNFMLPPAQISRPEMGDLGRSHTMRMRTEKALRQNILSEAVEGSAEAGEMFRRTRSAGDRPLISSRSPGVRSSRRTSINPRRKSSTKTLIPINVDISPDISPKRGHIPSHVCAEFMLDSYPGTPMPGASPSSSASIMSMGTDMETAMLGRASKLDPLERSLKRRTSFLGSVASDGSMKLVDPSWQSRHSCCDMIWSDGQGRSRQQTRRNEYREQRKLATFLQSVLESGDFLWDDECDSFHDDEQEEENIRTRKEEKAADMQHLTEEYLTLESGRRTRPQSVSTLDSNMFDALYMRACMRPPRLLDRWLEKYLVDLRKSIAILSPNTTGLTNSVFEILLRLGLCALLAVWTVSSTTASMNREPLVKSVRFEMSSSGSLAASTLQQFAEMVEFRDHCYMDFELLRNFSRDAVVVTFPEFTKVDGWGLADTTALATVSVKPFEWDGQRWQPLGTSATRIGLWGNRVFLSTKCSSDACDGSFGPLHRWPWIMAQPLTFGVGCLLLIMNASLAMADKGQLRNICTRLGLGVVIFLQCIAGLTYLSMMEYSESFGCWVRLMMAAIYMSKVLESRTVPALCFWLLSLCTIYITATLVDRLVLHFEPGSLLYGGELPCVLGLVCVLLGILLRYYRSVHSILTNYSNDKAQYDEIWNGIESDPANVQAIADLHHLCQNISAGFSSRPEHRLPKKKIKRNIKLSSEHLGLRSPSDPDTSRSTSMVLAQTPLDNRKVKSLDALMIQASVLRPYLISKTQQWAIASDAWLPSESADLDSTSHGGLVDSPLGASILKKRLSLSSDSRPEDWVRRNSTDSPRLGSLSKFLRRGEIKSGLDSPRLGPTSRRASRDCAHGSFNRINSNSSADEPRMIKWKEIVNAQDAEKLIRWTPLKSFPKALHKAASVYQKDASRCVDLCRQCMVFSDINSLIHCVNIISDDPDIEIVGLKNTMGIGYDSRQSAGFRFVKLNLRIKTPITTSLGIHGHVAEMLLLLRPFIDLKDHRERHKRYLLFRKGRSKLDELNQVFNISGVFSAFPALRALVSQMGPRLCADCVDDKQSPQTSPRIRTPKFWLGNKTDDKCWKNSAFLMSDPDKQLSDRTLSHFRTSCQDSPGVLDLRMAQEKHEAVAKASTGSVFLMSNPLGAMVSHKVYVAAMSLVTLVLIGISIRDYVDLKNNMRITGQSFRLKETGIGQAKNFTNVESFAVLLDGCEESCSSSRVIRQSEHYHMLTCPDGTEMNGFSFRLAEHVMQQEVVEFAVDVQDSDGSWRMVGSSQSFQCSPHKNCHSVRPMKHLVSEADTFVVNLGQTWPYILLWALKDPALILCLVTAILYCYLRRKPTSASYVVILTFSWRGLVSLIAAQGLLETAGGWAVAAPALIEGGASLILALVISWREQWFPLALMSMETCTLAARYVAENVLEIRSAPLDLILNQVTVLVVFAVWANVMHVYVLLKAKQHSSLDEIRHQEIWRQILSDPDSVTSLRHIRESIFRLSTGAQDEVRQRCLPQHALHETRGQMRVHWWAQAYLHSVEKLFPLCPPVGSMQQLFNQAEIIQPLLQSKAQQWAAQSRGMFAVRQRLNNGFEDDALTTQIDDSIDTMRYQLWSDIKEDQGMMSRVKFATLKGVERAIEKVYRCYHGDVSRLCDIAREAIVFQTPADLHECIREISNDPEVIIQRFKNSLDPDCPTMLLAGYRQVSMNIQLVTRDTLRLGIAMHCAELQLLLLPFAECKSEKGHKRYRTLRDAKGT